MNPAHADPPGNDDRQRRAAADSTPSYSAPSRSARPEAAVPRPNPSEQGGELNVPVVVANVNAQRVTREGLARECLREYGNDVLDSMVNRELIVQECQRRNLVVTAKEVDAEIDRLAQHFRFPVDQWLKLLQQEKGITPRQYAQTSFGPHWPCGSWPANGSK